MGESFTVGQRSACMRAVGSKDTEPEMRVRRLVHSMGYRYALHTANLPGKPDLVFVSRRKVIFVHGCFWHKHSCRHGSTSPATNSGYWKTKLEKNAQRDRQHTRTLRKGGWGVLVLWECQIKHSDFIRRKLGVFLRDPTSTRPAGDQSPN